MPAIGMWVPQPAADAQLAVRVPHMAAAAIIGETGNGLNPL
jgi:hypothetical protein